jgi:hypothetical protein
MNRPLLALFLLTGGLLAMPTGAAPSDPARILPRLPLLFEANVGQREPTTAFFARGAGYTVALSRTASIITLPTADRQWARLEMRLAGANTTEPWVGENRSVASINYLRGNNPRQWKVGVPAFARVRQRAVYPGIDYVCYGDGSRLEYDFHIAPGADPKRIELAFSGADWLSVDRAGTLLLHLDKQTLRQPRPIVYQNIGGKRRTVRGDYVLTGRNRVRFRLGDYDRTRPLIIDPTVWYSTFLGGSGFDSIRDIAIDAAGNTYVTGSTTSTDFPATGNAFQDTKQFASDVFVVKYGPTTDNTQTPAVLYATYLGGSADDGATGIAVDSSGRAHICGATGSFDFPVSKALLATFGGGHTSEFPTDGFVAKLSANGGSLVYSTYLGGSRNDEANDIAIDADGNANVCGGTSSQNFPIKNAFDASNTTARAPFVTKFGPIVDNKVTLAYSTYISTGTARGIAVDSFGDIYVTGFTDINNFPTKSADPNSPPFQDDRGGTDAFVARLNPFTTGNASLVYSTYLGGSGSDSGFAIAVDDFQRVFVTGITQSSDFPMKFPLDSTIAGTEAFVTALNTDGSAALYSTYLGGTNNESGLALVIQPREPGEVSLPPVWVTGRTQSVDTWPRIPGTPIQRPTHDTVNQAFVVRVSPVLGRPTPGQSGQPVIGSTLTFSELFGAGGKQETGWGIARDTVGNVSFAGETEGASFDTVNAPQDTFGGRTDGFVVKIGGIGQPDTVQVAATPRLWPPDDKLHDVSLAIGLTDPALSVDAYEVEIYTDAVNGQGCEADAVLLPNGKLLLRAERGREGRVYLILARAKWRGATVSIAPCTVIVPKNQSEPHLLDLESLAADVWRSAWRTGDAPEGFHRIAARTYSLP